MDSFDKTAKKAKEFFNVAYKKTEETINVQKLKYRLSAAENNLKNMYAALGEIWYKELGDTKNVSEEAAALITGLEFELKEIEVLKAEISELTGNVICPECGASSPKNASFCIKCGKKFTAN